MVKGILEKRALAAKVDGKYTDNFKYKAVLLYTQVGSLRAVGNALGIPECTMKEWHLKDWWKDFEDDLKAQTRHKLTGQMQVLKDKAIKIVEDRLDNGDFFFDQKEGVVVRKPINADVASNIMRVALDKHLQMEELALKDKQVETQEKVADRLMKLGLDFKRFAQAKEVTHDALHDQRETGLSEGESLGSPERGPEDQGSSGSESRSSTG